MTREQRNSKVYTSLHVWDQRNNPVHLSFTWVLGLHTIGEMSPQALTAP